MENNFESQMFGLRKQVQRLNNDYKGRSPLPFMMEVIEFVVAEVHRSKLGLHVTLPASELKEGCTLEIYALLGNEGNWEMEIPLSIFLDAVMDSN